MRKEPIYVTQPYLPPLEEFIPYLQQMWDKKILTNGGPFHQQLDPWGSHSQTVRARGQRRRTLARGQFP